MNFGYIVLIGICIAALLVLAADISAVWSNRYTVLKFVCISLFIFSMLRYLVLIVYGDSPSYNQLTALRYFYLASSIGLTIPTVSALWYIVPLYRDKINYPRYLLFFTPWILFYLLVIMTQPTRIIQGERFGYVLELSGKYPFYLSIAQGSMAAIIILLSLIGMIRYRNIQLRAELIVIIIAQIILVIDGLSYFIEVFHVFQPFTISEVFGFWAVYYAFSNKIIEIKGIKNQLK